MDIRSFLKLACTGDEEIILCDCTSEPKNIFEGTADYTLFNESLEVENALQYDISSWDMENGKLCINFVTE